MHPFVVFFVVSPHIGGHIPPSHEILHCGVEARRKHGKILREGRRGMRHEGENGRGTGLLVVMVVVPWLNVNVINNNNKKVEQHKR